MLFRSASSQLRRSALLVAVPTCPLSLTVISTPTVRNVVNLVDWVPLTPRTDREPLPQGLEWNSTEVTFYADGVAINNLPAPCLTQPIG